MPAARAKRLTLVPLELGEANAFVAHHHRHHGPVTGHKFSLGAALGDKIVGVAIIGRPVARERQDGLTLEITRLATDGTRNACSFLYGGRPSHVCARLPQARPLLVVCVTPARRQAPDPRQAVV